MLILSAFIGFAAWFVVFRCGVTLFRWFLGLGSQNPEA
jgi:hypothetical protein